MSKHQPTLADRIVSWLNPVAGLQRAHARRVLAYYEAAKSDRTRKGRRETGSGNDAVLRAGSSLRQQARHFEQNYDLALGTLNTLVNNVVGQHGIGIEPQPRRADGTIDDELARQILALWKDWCRRPEVTRRHDWASAQRLLCRSWLRDGEVFAQTITGVVPYLNHGTLVPFSVEMLEADFVPMDLQSVKPMIVQGVEVNAWGAPLAYHVFRANPLEAASMTALGQTKRIPADNMLHLANVHRVRQLRGVSVFASVLQRFDDLKDYEESERIAAKIAASMAAFIKKGQPDQYEPNEDGTARQMKFRPGMVFDDLRPGEDIGTIDTNRPNPNLETYRSGQLKAVSAGAGPTYSSISRSYDGTYSAQRQELVEGWGVYGTLAGEFIGRIVQPVYEAFIAAAVASGQLRMPAGLQLQTLNDAVYLPPQMPWIDPKKEAEAFAQLEDRCYASGPEIVRRRGGNPIDVLEQQARWLREKRARDIEPPKTQAAAPPAQIEAESSIADVVTAQARTTTAMVEALAQANARQPLAPQIQMTVDVTRAGMEKALSGAVSELTERVKDMPIIVNVPEQQAPQITVNVEAPQVTVEAPTVHVEAAQVPPAQVVVAHASKSVQRVERDKNGEILQTITTHEV